MGIGTVIIAFAGLLLLVLAIAVLIPMSHAFRRELKYVNMKILNSRHDKEQAYWERRKKKLMLSLLPFHHYNPHGHHHREED